MQCYVSQIASYKIVYDKNNQKMGGDFKWASWIVKSFIQDCRVEKWFKKECKEFFST